MAKKNSMELQVFLSLPGFSRLEGTILEITPTGVIFESRKPGGQNRIQEFVPQSSIIAVVGNEGKEGVLWKFDSTTIFGTKQRNTQMIANPTSYGTEHQRGSSAEYDTVIINTRLASMKNEIKSEEGGRGRKPGKAKAEKTAKADKPSKGGNKGKKDDWG
jgi:hypothetical protein